MKRSAGFTLIELIIVIVILGILAVTAAPKFMNMQGDARAATINAMKGSVQSAANMVYSKAVIKGLDKTNAANTTVVFDGTNYAYITYGYPTATTNGIGAILDTTDWTMDTTSVSGSLIFVPKGFTPTTAGTCGVIYAPATGTTSTTGPAITTAIDGC